MIGEGRKFAVDHFRVYAKTSKDIASKAITSLAFNANKSFGFYADDSRHCTIVIGRNKPDNLPLLGIFWEELEVNP